MCDRSSSTSSSAVYTGNAPLEMRTRLPSIALLSSDGGFVLCFLQLDRESIERVFEYCQIFDCAQSRCARHLISLVITAQHTALQK